jgi:N utilization substance protein B
MAVQVLYSMETRPGQDLDGCLENFTSDAGLGSEEREGVKSHMCFLVRGVWLARSDIDDIMRRVIIGWRLERMVAVDRAVLRVAIFEGFLAKDNKIPVPVAISEAVEIARTFGTGDSSKFVNGVLAKVMRFIEDGSGDNEDGKAGNDEKNASLSANSAVS